jgi:hypothetical protein
MVDFPHYTYPAMLPMLGVALKLGKFPMPGVEEVPKERMAGLQAEFAGAGAGAALRGGAVRGMVDPAGSDRVRKAGSARVARLNTWKPHASSQSISSTELNT